MSDAFETAQNAFIAANGRPPRTEAEVRSLVPLIMDALFADLMRERQLRLTFCQAGQEFDFSEPDPPKRRKRRSQR